MSVAGVFDMDWPGPIEIFDVQSTAVPIRNAWYYYELVIDKAAMTVSLFINDTVDVVVPLPGSVSTWLIGRLRGKPRTARLRAR